MTQKDPIVENQCVNIDLVSDSVVGEKIPDDTVQETDMLHNKYVDIRTLFKLLGIKLAYRRSGETSHVFKTIDKNKNTKFAVKIKPYEKNSKCPVTNTSKSLNISGFKYIPHIMLPISTFRSDITNFTNIASKIINLDDEKNITYKHFIERFNNNEFENNVSVSVYEWCDMGALLNYIKINYTKLTLRWWTSILFQLFYTLAIIHTKYPSFRHDDLKLNNILLKTTNLSKDTKTFYKYKIGNKSFVIPTIGLQIRLNGFALYLPVEQKESLSGSDTNNKYCNIHNFFTELIKNFPEFYSQNSVPKEIVEFVDRVIPVNYRDVNQTDIGSKLITDEYTTPYKLIMKDPLFEKYRFDKK